jgi:N-acetylmuramoyl-L-alanine amidase
LASRANQGVWLGLAFACAAALPCSVASLVGTASAQSPATFAIAATVPAIATDARLAGDAKQTRFVLDLDKTIQYRAFTLGDPYRVVVDIPQVDFRLPAGAGSAGRGLVKAFRYGLVMPGGSRIVFDLTGPAKITNSYMLDAANGQPSRLVLEIEQVDRAAFNQAAAMESKRELKPAIAGVNPAAPTDTAAPPKSASPPDLRPVVVIDPGHGGIDNGTRSGGEVMEKDLVLGFGLALRDRVEKSGKYRVVMTRSDDTFIPLNDRVQSVGGAVRFDPCRRAAPPRRRCAGSDDLYVVRQGLRRRGRAAGRGRKQGGRHWRR